MTPHVAIQASHGRQRSFHAPLCALYKESLMQYMFTGARENDFPARGWIQGDPAKTEVGHIRVMMDNVELALKGAPLQNVVDKASKIPVMKPFSRTPVHLI